MPSDPRPDSSALVRVVRIVALLNLGYFAVEFGVARSIGSVSLFADSIDFLEDASVNALILLAFGWSTARRPESACCCGDPADPGIATLWTRGRRSWLRRPVGDPVDARGSGALAVNLFCALLLVRFRNESGSLTRAAFLSARNDAIANFAIIGQASQRGPPSRPGPISRSASRSS